MDTISLNHNIQDALIKIRDEYYFELRSHRLSEQYAELYLEFNSLRKDSSFDDDTLNELSELMQDTTKDEEYIKIIDSVNVLDDNSIIGHFEKEIKKVFEKIYQTGRISDIGAIFFEYDYYYHYNSCAECYGKQTYPIVLSPRYISSEYNFNDRIFFVEKAINFKPAWPDCEELDSLDLLNLNIEKLFQLHSRVLLNKAFSRLQQEGFFAKILNEPMVVYINEHDCEVVTLYFI